MQQRFTNPEGQVPRPSRRNPFKVGGIFATQFNTMLKAYAAGHQDIVRQAGTRRHMGNALATAFWRGYDGTPPLVIPRNALVWACYRAGQTQRLLDADRGVYVPPLAKGSV